MFRDENERSAAMAPREWFNGRVGRWGRNVDGGDPHEGSRADETG